jgi:hypothetical protein
VSNSAARFGHLGGVDHSGLVERSAKRRRSVMAASTQRSMWASWPAPSKSRRARSWRTWLKTKAVQLVGSNAPFGADLDPLPPDPDEYAAQGRVVAVSRAVPVQTPRRRPRCAATGRWWPGPDGLAVRRGHASALRRMGQAADAGPAQKLGEDAAHHRRFWFVDDHVRWSRRAARDTAITVGNFPRQHLSGFEPGRACLAVRARRTSPSRIRR